MRANHNTGTRVTQRCNEGTLGVAPSNPLVDL